MKKYSFVTVTTFICILLFSSCLKYGLEEVELSNECEITNVQFEHRWAVPTGGIDGIYTLYFQAMTVNRNSDGNRITLDITVPAVSNSFPQAERDKVSLSSIACLFFVSNAATVLPLNGAPTLGTLGDFSGKSFTYRVTSASGEYKDWQIIINDFIK